MNGEVFNEGPTTSQHVESTDDDHFQKASYKLKRTRSMGLLDDFISTAKPMSKDTDSVNTPGGNTKKITSRDFISDETLRRLNIKPTYDEGSANVPSFYTSVLPPSARKKGAKQNSNSPSSFQSDEFFEDNYNSEDSLSSLGSAQNTVNLTPKHQLKKQQQLQETQQRYELEQNQQLHGNSSSKQSNNHHNNNNNNNNNTNNDILMNNNEHLHDDTDVHYSAEQHVDYFSHNWDESELTKSWRYIIGRRADFENASRLENASWRQWAQYRLRLAKISPEKLNWSKDTDVDWLYGPILKDDKHDFDIDVHFIDQQKRKQPVERSNSNSIKKTGEPQSSASSFSSMDGNDEENDGTGDHLKSILKMKSNVERLISEASYSRLQHLLEKSERKQSTAGGLGRSPILESTNNNLISSPPVYPITSGNGVERSPQFMLSDNVNSIDEEMTNSPMTKADSLVNSKKDRHIHFNMRVDQCIALDEYGTDYSTDYDYDSEEGNQSSLVFTQSPYEDHDYPIEEEDAEDRDLYADDYDDDDDDDDDDEDGGFVLSPKSKLNSISHHPHNNAKKILTGGKSVFTISPLPATTLKNCSDDENEVELETVSHSARSGRGYDYYYDFNSVYDPSTYHQDLDDIEMYDVPEDCQLEDVPEDCQLDDTMDIDKPQQSPVLGSVSTIQGSPSLYSTPGSVSTIKVGLSGLDLSSSGLKRSTGVGSKPQLFQMGQQQFSQQQAPISSHNSFIKKPSTSNINRKTFTFDDSDDSFSEEHETDDDDNEHQDDDNDDGEGLVLTTRSHSNLNLNKSNSFLLSNYNNNSKSFSLPFNSSSSSATSSSLSPFPGPPLTGSATSGLSQDQAVISSNNSSEKDNSYHSLSSIAENGYTVSSYNKRSS